MTPLRVTPLLLASLLLSNLAFAGLSFDSANDYITGNNGANVDNVRPGTMAAWVYPKSMGEGNFGTIASKTDQNGGWYVEFSGSAGTNQIEYFYEDGATDLIRRSNSSFITLNQWNHVAVVMDTTQVAADYHIYVNGREVTYLTSQNSGTALNSDAAGILIIGNERTTADTFDGYIADYALWDVQLTSQDIAVLASSRGIKRMPLQVKKNNLRVYYELGGSQDGFVCPVSTDANAISFPNMTNRGNNCAAVNGPTGKADDLVTYQ